MVEKMCTFYGTKIATVNGTNYYDFPSVENLANITVINDLQKAAFGYRAKYIQQAASKIIEFGGIEWILQLQSLPYKKAKIELMKLPGIGAKVIIKFVFIISYYDYSCVILRINFFFF